jgi:hypothetical protein
MKRILAFLLVALFGLSFAWQNEATGDMLQARYEYVKCDVDYAKDWLSMREDCGQEENVTVFDSSEYVEELDEGLADLKEAADDADQLEFGLTSWQMGADALDLLGAIFVDALQNKTLAFFSCVRDGEEPLIADRDECRVAALQQEKVAAIDYVNNELDFANGKIEELDELGADASGMEAVVADGHELLDDVEAGYDSGDPKEVRKLHMRHSRLVLLFRMEQMLATVDYARPVIEESNNGNKEEILDEMDELEDDINEALDECEYSADIDNSGSYGAQNAECWADSVSLFADFNSIQVLILEGIFK